MNKYLDQAIKREKFQKDFDALLMLSLDDIKLKAELKKLIETSNIDISFPYKDTVYEDVVQLLEEEKKDQIIKSQEEKKFVRKYNPKYKPKYKKVYKDEYEAERDFKLNIYKKNLYATPYFQEKKRRNAFNFNKSKPKDKSNWKKKGKIHQK
jgi:hypothetical protein